MVRDDGGTRVRMRSRDLLDAVKAPGDETRFAGFLSLHLVPVGGYVYLLISHGHVVYIGQTTNLLGRIADHRASKRFDRVLYYPIDPMDLDSVEAELIRRFRPKLNSTAHCVCGTLIFRRGKWPNPLRCRRCLVEWFKTAPSTPATAGRAKGGQWS